MAEERTIDLLTKIDFLMRNSKKIFKYAIVQKSLIESYIDCIYAVIPTEALQTEKQKKEIIDPRIYDELKNLEIFIEKVPRFYDLAFLPINEASIYLNNIVSCLPDSMK